MNAIANRGTSLCCRDVHCCDANHSRKRCKGNCNSSCCSADQVTVNGAGGFGVGVGVGGGDVGSGHWFELDCEGHSLGQTHHRRFCFRLHPPSE